MQKRLLPWVLAAAVAALGLVVWWAADNETALTADAPASGPPPTASAAPDAGDSAADSGREDTGPTEHEDIDFSYESIALHGSNAVYTHEVGGFQVVFPSALSVSVPRVSGPIQGRFFYAADGADWRGMTLYAAAAEGINLGGDVVSEFEAITDEELAAMGRDFLSASEEPQRVSKLFKDGVPGIEIVAKDLEQGMLQISRIYFHDDRMVMVSGLTQDFLFQRFEGEIRAYLDSLTWL